MSGHSSHNGPGYETTDVSFNTALWWIPTSMVLVFAYAAICYFGVTKTLKHEIAQKFVPGTATDSSSQGGGTPSP